MNQNLLTAVVLILILAISAVVYSVNFKKINVQEGVVDCESFNLRVPPGTYTLNYTVYDPSGDKYGDISVTFTLDNTTCKYVRGITLVQGQGTGIPWITPTIYGPFALPRLGETVSVNIVPLFYANLALFIYYPVNASRIASGTLETPYGVLPVSIYEYTMPYNSSTVRGYDTAKLYYDISSGLLVGADYSAYIEGRGQVQSYSLRLSGLMIKPLDSEYSVKDAPSTLAAISASGVIGGVSGALAAVELSRRRD